MRKALCTALLSLAAIATTAAPAASAAPEELPFTPDACTAAATPLDANWTCLGDDLRYTVKTAGGKSREYYRNVASKSSAVDITGKSPNEVAGLVNAAHAQSTASSATRQSVRPHAIKRQGVSDAYHATNQETIKWQINGHYSETSFSYTISIYYHSADVLMRYFDSTSTPIELKWDERLRHNIGGGSDQTTWTAPFDYGPTTPYSAYSELIDHRNTGYNILPFQTGWKMFFDAFNMGIYYNGTYQGVGGSVQSTRFTCYKTVDCKFSV